MEKGSQREQLPIGRAAFARVVCIEWIMGHTKTILLSFATLILFSFCIYQVFSRFGDVNVSESSRLERAFNEWSGSQDLTQLKELEKSVRGHSALEAKYGTLLAQRLLGLGEVKQGEEYARAALKRAQGLNTPYYSDFSKNTLLITSGKYSEALEASEKLKGAMLQDEAFWSGRDKLVRSGSVLYAYNLLRIAMLNQQLGSKEGELIAWDELVQNAGWKGVAVPSRAYDPESYALLLENFTQGDITLIDYIDQRRADLSAVRP